MNNHRISEHWQQLKESALAGWVRLAHDSAPKKRLEPPLYGKPEKKDFFERICAVSGNIKINEYVQNPAPGRSERRREPRSNSRAKMETRQH